MSLEQLKSEISEGIFRPFYYLYGKEPYLKQFYLRQLLAALLPDNADLDLHRYEGKQTDVSAFSEELLLYPIGARKAMLVTDLPASAPLADFLASAACEIPEGTSVIVYALTEQPDIRTAAWKALKKKYDQSGLFVPIETVDDITLARWIKQQFSRRGRVISDADTAYFLSVEERNMESMLTEIEKLSAYCADGTVTREALVRLCVKTVQARVFELNDLILQKNADRAYALLNDLWALRTAPQVVLATLFSCFAGLYQLKVLEGQSTEKKAELTGMKPFAVRKYETYLKRIPLAALDRLMDSCAEIDVLSKSTAVDPTLLTVRLVTEALERL